MNYRPLRVGQLIRDELAELVTRDVECPDTLITITEVDISKKIDHATVRVSVIPEKNAAKALAALGNAQGELQHKLLKKINIKPMPRIQFTLDRGSENAAEVEKALLQGHNKEDSAA